MKSIIISREEFRDKVYACWLGKNIGGTLGEPYEGHKEILSLTFYDPLPKESALPNDDLDLQLVWLKMLQDHGINPSLNDFAEYWMKHLYPYPSSEYGFCQRNLQKGLRPPISGCFENGFIDNMGSPIRSEIWACLAPGDPQLAAVMAWKDAVLDHAGGEGVWGEMFWAAVESAAFVIDDPITLIRVGLNMIPMYSQISRAVKAAVWCYENSISHESAREMILKCFGQDHQAHAPKNIAFTIIGWLYGKDFGDKLCTAVNCGHDTDCTGATLGAILGILGGTKGIPKEWSAPIGEKIVLFRMTVHLDPPPTITELTRQTVELAEKVLSGRSHVAEFGESTMIAHGTEFLWENEEARKLWSVDMETSVLPVGDGLEVTIHYCGEPVIRPGVPKTLKFRLERDGLPVQFDMRLETPSGWILENLEDKETGAAYRVRFSDPEAENMVKVHIKAAGKEYAVEFLLLGPQGAKGWRPGTIVDTCPNCRARVEACLCKG